MSCRTLTCLITEAFSNAALPSVFVSCKCDIPPLDRAVDPLIIERGAKRDIKNLITLSMSATSPETHKRGLSMVLSAVLARLTGGSFKLRLFQGELVLTLIVQKFEIAAPRLLQDDDLSRMR